MTKNTKEISVPMKTGSIITVIGGCSIDIQGVSTDVLKLQDSNPGKLSTSPGGVGRNIASSMARLGLPVRLLTAIGKDENGEYLRLSTQEDGIDMSEALYSEESPTSVYLSVLDEKGEMVVAINQMDILKKVNIEYLKTKEELIHTSSIVVIDANIGEEEIHYICKTHQDKMIFADPVSTIKSKKLKTSLKYLYAIKPNLLEMESLVGRRLKGMRDYKKAMKELLDLGIEQVYLTLGKEGVLVADRNNLIHATGEVTLLESVTGAGDAFLAASVYATSKGWDIERLAGFSQAVALISLEHINKKTRIEEEKIENRRKGVKTHSLPR